MDPQQFDSLAKRLGTRLSRRSALRASAGAALSALALGRLAPAGAQDPETTVKDRFISVRTYDYTGPISAAQEGLKALVSLMEEQPGFISIDFVSGSKAIYIVASFLDKTTAVAASKVEDTWIAENAEAILAGKPEIHSGTVFLRSELQAGCGCVTGVEDACNSERLICCGATDLDGGPGICLTAATTCPGVETTPPTATAVPPPPTEVPACTGAGCGCLGGVDGACDDGLVCCTDSPGGEGVCLTEAECYPPCTGEGCACTAGTEGACDAGLQCCGADLPGGQGTCAYDCGGGACTGEGCACTGGVEGACDAGLQCCADTPGGQGVCAVDCGGGACTSEGCECISGTEGACDAGLECCGAGGPGGTGSCQTACG